jgi:putative spermidine/putrescine transport system substrate-binding protein
MSLSLIMAARAKGGSERNMEEAWKMLREIKPYIATVAATSAAAVPYLENEQIWIGSFWSARSAYYINRGLPYGVMVPKEGTALNANTSSIPIGASNKKLAFEFLNFRLEPDIQKSFCDEYFASPGRPDIQGWSETFVAQQITSEEKMAKMVGTDDQYLGEAVRDWTLKWQETMA